MLHWFRRMKSEKGQGLVEFALILAFCAVIAWAVSKSGFGETISALLDSGDHPEYVTAAIGGNKRAGSGETGSGETGSGETGGGGTGGGETGGGETGGGETGGGGTGGGGTGGGETGGGETGGGETGGGETGGGGTGGGSGWGWDDERRLDDPTTYYQDEASQAERLAKDQDALINIAKHFIGLTMEQVQGLLNGKNADMADSNANNREVLLGHLEPVGNNKGMKFNADATLNKAEAENIFAWMQGNQDTVMSDSSNKDTLIHNDMYDPNYMYMVSDYIVSQNWADTGGTNQKNGLRMQLEYDYSCAYSEGGYIDANKVKVVGVNLAIDPRSQDNEVLGQVAAYNSQSSAGLNVQVLLNGTDENGNPNYIISRNDTAIHVDANTGTSGNSMVNWYGVNTTAVVQNYIAGKATVITNTTSEMKEFSRGDIIYAGGKYYIAVMDGTVAVKSNSTQAELEYKPGQDAKIFAKFTGDPSKNYYHINDKTDYVAASQSFKKKTMTYRGYAMIMRNGEVYVYVGDKEGVVYSGINDVDYIKIRDAQIVNDSSGAVYH